LAQSTLKTLLSAAALSYGSLLAGGCAGDLQSAQNTTETGQALGREHLQLTAQAQSDLQTRTAQASGHMLKYYGGPVLKNINVIPIYWNSSTNFQSNLNAFYSDFTGSTSTMYNSLLTQYSSIGAGTSTTYYVDSAVGGNLTDAQVQAELTRLFKAGAIPAPNANNYYPVHFPSGTTITDSSGNKSCVVFCAYHGTYVYNNVNVNYGIIPDIGSGGCQGGCGTNASTVNNLTSVSSHELCEATTDPAVGLATVYAPPLAWYNATYGEIGDECNAQQASITANGNTYVVQKEWSNAGNACKTVK